MLDEINTIQHGLAFVKNGCGIGWFPPAQLVLKLIIEQPKHFECVMLE